MYMYIFWTQIDNPYRSRLSFHNICKLSNLASSFMCFTFNHALCFENRGFSVFSVAAHRISDINKSNQSRAQIESIYPEWAKRHHAETSYTYISEFGKGLFVFQLKCHSECAFYLVLATHRVEGLSMPGKCTHSECCV